MTKVPLKFRAPTVSDKSFIFNSWLKSFRHSPLAKPLCNEVYFKNHKVIVENILKRSRVLIACNPEDEDQIYGYIVYEPIIDDITVLHYVYVKFTYRKLGIARTIVEGSIDIKNPILYTHHTETVKRIKDKLDLIYDPYRL